MQNTYYAYNGLCVCVFFRSPTDPSNSQTLCLLLAFTTNFSLYFMYTNLFFLSFSFFFFFCLVLILFFFFLIVLLWITETKAIPFKCNHLRFEIHSFYSHFYIDILLCKYTLVQNPKIDACVNTHRGIKLKSNGLKIWAQKPNQHRSITQQQTFSIGWRNTYFTFIWLHSDAACRFGKSFQSKGIGNKTYSSRRTPAHTHTHQWIYSLSLFIAFFVPLSGSFNGWTKNRR